MKSKFEELIRERSFKTCAAHPDPAHDFLHVERVVGWAKSLAKSEGAEIEIVVPAAYLHDVVYVSKGDPRRSRASLLSAEEALRFLRSIEYPSNYLDGVFHAIEAHSFSANIKPKTIEAKVVQDADRLDALGAIGIARCFSTSSALQRSFYSEIDPFCLQRAPNEKEGGAVDHFYTKLLRLKDGFSTNSGRAEAIRRTKFLETYLIELKRELFSFSFN